MDVEKAMHKLSEQQKQVLTWLYEAQGDTDPAWGVQWQPGKWFEDWTATDRATLSRTLRRLEQRGLLLRSNQMSSGERGWPKARTSPDLPHDRTTHVKLTELGREVAKRLT